MKRTWRRNLKKYKHQVIVEQTASYDGWDGVHFTSNFLWFRDGLLRIKKGYAWDGASGPVIQTETLVDASVYHDALYQILRGQLSMNDEVRERYRKRADVIFKEKYLSLCEEAYLKDTWQDRLHRYLAKKRAVYIYQVVRKFGRKSTLPKGA